MEKLNIHNPEFWTKFYEHRDHTGRFCIISHRTGVKYAVEPMGGRSDWGDVDPVTKKTTGSYGSKYRGSIDREDSLITQENGFKNIIELPKGYSPEAYIEWKDAQYPDKSELDAGIKAKE